MDLFTHLKIFDGTAVVMESNTGSIGRLDGGNELMCLVVCTSSSIKLIRLRKYLLSVTRDVWTYEGTRENKSQNVR